MESVTLSVELYTENGKHYAWIATETGSGCKYEITKDFSPGDALNKFIKDDADEFSAVTVNG